MERLHPDVERVEVPYEGTSLPAWWVKGRGEGARPTVVLFDGMDNAKEMSVIFAGLDFAALEASNPVPSRSFDEVDDIVSYLAQSAVEGDHIVVMSNGGFGGIHDKLLRALRR